MEIDYTEHHEAIATICEEGNTLFDYESKDGNKAARSLIYRARRVKGAIDTTRKNLKAEALQFGRDVDAKAKELTAQVEAVIQRHQAPIDAIEQREKDRVQAHQNALENIRQLGALSNEPVTSEQLDRRLRELESMSVGPEWEEFMAEATQLRSTAIETIKMALERQKAYEAEQKRLADEKAERERAEREQREARIAEAAAKAAKEEAERAAKEEADKKAREAAAREQQIQREKDEAEQRLREAEEREAAAERRRQQQLNEEKKRAAQAEKSRGDAIAAAVIAIAQHYPSIVDDDDRHAFVLSIASGEIDCLNLEV